MKKKERVRKKSNEAEGTYREAADEVDKDCKRNIEEENEKELKLESVGRKSKPRREKNNQKRRKKKKLQEEAKKEEEEAPERAFSPLFSRISTSAGLTFPLTRPTLLALDSPLCLQFKRILLLFLLYSS